LGDITDLQAHILFTSPKVGDIVRLLVEKSNDMGKSDEELLEEAKVIAKRAYSEILGLNEDEVIDDTDFFEAGGGSLQVRKLIHFLKAEKGQELSIKQHELFAAPTVIAVAEILVEKAKKAGNGSTKPQKSIESVVEALLVDNKKYYPASYAQEQTFVLNASGAGAAYNMPWIVDFKGKFNKQAMIQAHDLVVKREQPLRTVLRLNPTPSKTKDGIVQQRVLPMEWMKVVTAGSYVKTRPLLMKSQLQTSRGSKITSSTSPEHLYLVYILWR
jgi:aryl carrier-like protein